MEHRAGINTDPKEETTDRTLPGGPQPEQDKKQSGTAVPSVQGQPLQKPQRISKGSTAPWAVGGHLASLCVSSQGIECPRHPELRF